MAEWDALPPRRKQRRSDHSTCEESAKLVKKEPATKKLAESLLSSKDGVGSEFYEYLDHTADIQLHAWGDSLRHAFENIVPCMFNYITDLSLVEIDENENVEFIVKGHDMKSLLFNMLDEFLYRFSTAGFVCKTAKVMNIDEVNFTMLIVGYGCIYDRTVHVQGTEIKAITYSNMQIHGIGGEDDTGSTTTGTPAVLCTSCVNVPSDGPCICCPPIPTTGETGLLRSGRVDLFVIVDI